MKTARILLAAAAAAILAACGGGAPPDDGGPPPTEATLWPLGTGARWTYRVTDPLLGIFQKVVRVEGQGTVPGSGAGGGLPAVLVRDVEPSLDETSWQVRDGGLVFRAREEDRRDGAVVRTTTWSPAEMKAISKLPPGGWVHDSTVHQTIAHADGTVTEKDERFVWTVAATDERVTVPAGTFDGCVRVVRTNPEKPGSERTYWLAPGVGKVKETGERTEELLSYEPPPAG